MIKILMLLMKKKKDSIDSDFSLFEDASNFERFINNFNSDLQ